ncbi:MAG: hypothetical protein IJM02_05475 [Clostridia bacterium]|nr:hypothetical protein [Clostridia bacterium]
MKQTSKCALGGITAALSLTLLISVAIVPFMTYALPALAGALIIVMVIETNKTWAFGVYSVISILAFFLVPEKEVAVMYIAFFGYYPIIKALIEAHIPAVPAWILKVLSFLTTITVSYYLMIKLMGLTLDELEEHGMWGAVMLLGIGAFAFVFYDIALTRLITLYLKKWRKHFKKYLK